MGNKKKRKKKKRNKKKQVEEDKAITKSCPNKRKQILLKKQFEGWSKV